MSKVTAIVVSIGTAILLLPAATSYAAQMSPLALLADAEKTYYENIFDYSMVTVQPNQKYDWASYSGKGTITLGDTFISKSGATCRNFHETFIVQGHNGIDQGVGCKRRGKDGWCKLDLNKAKTCSFEDTSRMFGGVGIDTPNINTPTIGAINTPTLGGTGSNTISAPNVNTDINSPVAKKDVTAKNYTDSVTGNAGKAADSAASNGLNWFKDTFLR